MTEFIKDVRRYCRNPSCRSKLPSPAFNSREAFCARGCHTSFYLRRCLVCEGPLQRRNKTQRVCRKTRCRNAWRAKAGFGRYLPSSAVSLASKTLDFIGSKPPLKPDRAWRQIAGPKLSPSQLHCATVPDGPNGQWEGGKYRRIEDRNRALLKAHFSAQAAKCLIQPHHPPVNILGGYKFPDAPDVKLREEKKPRFSSTAFPKPDANLDIPDFLKRC